MHAAETELNDSKQKLIGVCLFRNQEAMQKKLFESKQSYVFVTFTGLYWVGGCPQFPSAI